MLTGALTDSATGAMIGSPSSASARRESYAHPPLPGMSNSFIRSGETPARSIVAGVTRGLHIERLKGGEVDPLSGEFAFTASGAVLIEHGELTTRIRDVTLLGTAPAALRTIDAVGDDLAFTQALCDKDGQWVPVSYGSPTLLLHGLKVAGDDES